MTQPFEVSDRETRISGAVIVDAGRFAGIGIGLPDELAVDAQEKADLIERRLSRLEGVLGLEAICDR